MLLRVKSSQVFFLLPSFAHRNQCSICFSTAFSAHSSLRKFDLSVQSLWTKSLERAKWNHLSFQNLSSIHCFSPFTCELLRVPSVLPARVPYDFTSSYSFCFKFESVWASRCFYPFLWPWPSSSSSSSLPQPLTTIPYSLDTSKASIETILNVPLLFHHHYPIRWFTFDFFRRDSKSMLKQVWKLN